MVPVSCLHNYPMSLLKVVEQSIVLSSSSPCKSANLEFVCVFLVQIAVNKSEIARKLSYLYQNYREGSTKAIIYHKSCRSSPLVTPTQLFCACMLHVCHLLRMHANLAAHMSLYMQACYWTATWHW